MPLDYERTSEVGSTIDWGVALDTRRGPLGCAGRDARCCNPVEYRAVLTYCPCVETALTRHDPSIPFGPEHYGDVNQVPLCRVCAAMVRAWDCLTEMRDA